MRMAVAVAEKPQFNRSGLRFRADGARARINQPMSPQTSQDGLDGRSGLRIDRRSVRRERHTRASASNDLLTLDQDFRAADPSNFPDAQPENRNRFKCFHVNSHAVDRCDEPPPSIGRGGDGLRLSHPVADRRIGHNIRLSDHRPRRRSNAQLLDSARNENVQSLQTFVDEGDWDIRASGRWTRRAASSLSRCR